MNALQHRTQPRLPCDITKSTHTLLRQFSARICKRQARQCPCCTLRREARESVLWFGPRSRNILGTAKAMRVNVNKAGEHELALVVGRAAAISGEGANRDDNF